jgi:hypothetical protein
LLLLQARKKSQKIDPPPRLESREECERAEERDRARWLELQVQREEVAVARDCFELTRDKVIFGFEIGLTAAGFMAFLFLLVVNPALLLLGISGGSGCGSLLLLLRRPTS